jgi:hypothetical protein
LKYTSADGCFTWDTGLHSCNNLRAILAWDGPPPCSPTGPWTLQFLVNGTLTYSHPYTLSHNSSGAVVITSPTENQLFDLDQNNYTETDNVPFTATTNTGNPINWTVTLNYATSGNTGAIPPDIRNPGNGQSETYQSEGGQLKAMAQSTAADGSPVQDCVTSYVEGPAGGIPSGSITAQLDQLYPASSSYQTGGSATPNLMTGIAMRESTYTQFRTPQECNFDLFKLDANFGVLAKWPYETEKANCVSDGGSHIGLMQIATAANQSSDPNAWKWADPSTAAAANANDAVNLFSGTVNPNDIQMATTYETEIINGVASQNIPGYLNGNGSLMGQLNGFLPLENMALVLYGGYLIGCTDLQCYLTSQYYIPQCPVPGVQGTKKKGSKVIYLTCSTAWQWIPNTTNQANGLNYVQNGTNGVRDLLQ